MIFRIEAALVAILVCAGPSAAQIQRTPREAPPWIVSVLHSVEVDKMIARLRSNEQARVGVRGMAPSNVFNVGTGLVVDEKGHVVTRLPHLDPDDKNQTIVVTAADGTRHQARLVGLDCPTGFAVLEVSSLKVAPPSFAAASVLMNGLSVRIMSADAVAKVAPVDNKAQVNIGYAIKVDLGQVGAASPAAKARGALTLNSNNLLARSDGSVVTTFENQVAGLAQYAGFGRAYLFPIEFIRDTVAKRVLDRNGSVPAGWLGVKADDVVQLSEQDLERLGLVKRSGVIVREVMPDSAAAASDVRPEDVIVGVDDLEIATKAELSAALSASPAGKKMRLRMLRERQPLEMTAVLGERPYSGPTVPYVEFGQLAEANVSERDHIERRLEELRSQYRMYAGKAESKERTEVLAEITLEMRQIFDILRAMQEQEAQQRSIESFNRGGGSLLAGVRFAIGIVGRDLSEQTNAQMMDYLGLTTLGVKMGVWITGVDKGSVAEGAGIKVGDVVVAVQGQSQLTSMVLEKALSSVRGVITLRVVRDRQPLLIRVNSQQ